MEFLDLPLVLGSAHTGASKATEVGSIDLNFCTVEIFRNLTRTGHPKPVPVCGCKEFFHHLSNSSRVGTLSGRDSVNFGLHVSLQRFNHESLVLNLCGHEVMALIFGTICDNGGQ